MNEGWWDLEILSHQNPPTCFGKNYHQLLPLSGHFNALEHKIGLIYLSALNPVLAPSEKVKEGKRLRSECQEQRNWHVSCTLIH